MDDFHKVGGKVKEVQEDFQASSKDIYKEKNTIREDTLQINELIDRVNVLATSLGSCHQVMPLVSSAEELNIELGKILSADDKTDSDRMFDLNSVDYLVACLAGGIAVLLDFLVVKIPKDMNFADNGKKYHQEGSSLTALFDRIGKNDNGKEQNWIKVLETWFKVPYDKSLHPDIPHMRPMNHRVFSLAHDPSLSGLLWAVKDLTQGTFSYIDESGILHIMKCKEGDYLKLFYAPFVWMGHIVSDIFTTQGIPIPGSSLLRKLQLGAIGDNEMTIGKMATYMYENGYNLKHLATMTISNAAIEIIVRLYYYLVKPAVSESRIMAEREYEKVMLNRKLHNMLLIAYSVSVFGDIAKICAYQGNPNAINVAIWYGFVKEAVKKLQVVSRDNTVEKAIECRHIIDENFNNLISR